jgi:hypothetical protein
MIVEYSIESPRGPILVLYRDNPKISGELSHLHYDTINKNKDPQNCAFASNPK